jgi:histidine ammonia-lyase
MIKNRLKLSGRPLKFKQISDFVSERLGVEISPQVRQNLTSGRRVVEEILKKEKPVYGINTGFGNFAEVQIKTATVNELQRRLILSHAAGVGDPVHRDIVRLILLLKIQALSQGYSGCRLETVQLMQAMLNSEVLPVIPEKGSVGASGDLAPLAHLALVMIGLGEAFTLTGKNSWSRLSGLEALTMHQLSPIEFAAKEGLAVLNGTQVITAYGLHTL